MKTKLFLFGLFFFGLVSCDKNSDVNLSGNPMLIGSWISPVYQDTIVSFTKAPQLKENEYGISFGNDGKFIERTISGWCATPPIAYIDNNGTWNTLDSIVSIKVAYWGGEAAYKWKIKSMTESKLILQIMSRNYNNPDE